MKKASSPETVAVLGASPNPERYAHKAIKMLMQHGHRVIPVSPAHSQIEGLPVTATLNDIHEPVDTLTVYVGPKNISPLISAILQLKPARVILNPGTESQELKDALDRSDIPYVEACTLVMLSTDQF